MANGTVAGGKATCPCCHVVLPTERVRAQLTSQRGGGDVQFSEAGKRIGGATLLAVVTLREGVQGRYYRLPVQRDYAAVYAAQKAVMRLPNGSVPDEPINPVRPSPNARGLSAVTRYGIQNFGDLFTARQTRARGLCQSRCEHFFLCGEGGGRVGREQIGKRFYGPLPLAPKREKLEGIYSRQAIAFVWDFCEGNPLSDSTGGLRCTGLGCSSRGRMESIFGRSGSTR